MAVADGFDAGAHLRAVGRAEVAGGPAGGLLDALGVAPVVLDRDGRIVLWSPQAEALLGYRADEALGRYAARLLVAEQDRDQVLTLFGKVMHGGETWAGVFPVVHRDGSVRWLEFRNMRLQDEHGGRYALGLAVDQSVLRQVEQDLALSVRLIDQSPIGLAVIDTDLRYVTVNEALVHLNGLSAAQHLGRPVREVLSFLDTDAVESSMRLVLATGTPLLDQYTVGRVPADPATERAWSVSTYRLEDSAGTVLGLATSVVDVTERHRVAAEAERARHRLAVIADASARIGTTLDVEQTARELAEVAVGEFADLAAVDILDTALTEVASSTATESMVFRPLIVHTAYPTPAALAADPPGTPVRYGPDRLISRCVRSRRPVLVAHVDDRDLARIAPDEQAAAVLARAGVHSYLAVPLIARGEILGAVDFLRARNPMPFSDDDQALALELASRAAVCIDNARTYQQQRHAALTLQRSFLPRIPATVPGLDIACRYQPAGSAAEIGGDWYDVLPLTSGGTALVVGDVMGSGIQAAAAMGRLRTATQTLAELDLAPDQVLQHLDRITATLEPSIATCLYAVHEEASSRLRIAVAGHLPPVLCRTGQAPILLDLPAGAPLGVGGVPFRTTTIPVGPGDRLLLYTDGLVETRRTDIDARLHRLLELLATPDADLEATCDRLLARLHHTEGHDDVALLLAQVQP
ncbi:SpoIIE family protein phosphatase [Streptomyces sp. NPDC045431]|uniref:SpoIIE family protein phosphatase n=1 Tax=Streptomyces sp. NPDC045431 TaxID=3155613 RepID=UPI0033F8CA43